MVDNTLLSIALPTIRRDLGSGTTGLQWVTGVYSLTFGGLLLTAGSMADRLGRRPAEESQHCGSQTGPSARSLDRDRDRARAAARMRA